jgi:hypothetical protein
MSTINAIQRVPTAEPSDQSPDLPPPPSGPPSTVYYPFPVAAPAQRGGPSLTTVLLFAILLLVLAMAAVFFLAVLSTLGAPGRSFGEAGQRAGEVVRAAGETAAGLGQDVRDRFDPSHPPRQSLAYDTEIDDLLKLGVGQPLPDGRTRVFTITAIQSRQDGDRPESARYAVIHTELRQPNETKLFGLTVRRDSEPQDHYVYQGETFRIAGRVYKVNWISPERQQVALTVLRHPDRVAGGQKFSYD